MGISNEFIMRPTNDFCFKELMQNEKVRKGFIAALLRIHPRKIKSTRLLPTILRRDSEDDKLGILDVRVELEDGTKIDLEMQVAAYEHWDNRIIFYLCKMYTEQIRAGESYANLKKCIHVSILDFIHIPVDSEFYRKINLREEKTGAMYSDLLEIHILELNKLPKIPSCEDEICDWMNFFRGKERKEFEEMAVKNEYIGEAYETLKQLSADEIKKLEYDAREKAHRDHISFLEYAQKKGFEEGRVKGEEKAVEYTRRIFHYYMQGKTHQEISALCQMPLEKVTEILSF